MASTPRANIAGDAARGLHCAICGQEALRVVHVERLPDYVECANCKSAFIMEEGGERVLYGQIAEGYPQTSQFALKQWVWMEAVETRAQEERPAGREEAIEPQETGLEEDLQPDASAAAPEAGPPQEDEWSILDDAEQLEDPESLGIPEAGPEFEGQGLRDLARSTADENQTSGLMDEEDLFEGLVEESYDIVDETDIQEPVEASTVAEEMDDSEEAVELSGFDWLGGLADEDTALEDPDLPLTTPVSSLEDPAEEIETEEAGLSAEDLDDLFKPEAEQAADIEQTWEAFEAEDDLFETPEWSSQEPSLPEEEVEHDEFDAAWLDDIELDEQEPQPESPITGLEQTSGAAGEPADEWGEWRSLEPELTGERMEEGKTPEDWLADRMASDGEEAEAEFSEANIADEGFSLDDDIDDDFLSSLRDSAAIPLESQPLEDPFLEGAEDEVEEPAVPSWALEDDQEDAVAMAARMHALASAEQDQAPQPALEELPEVEQEPISKDEINFRETDPPPGQRHRVVIGGARVVFPSGECVHCGRTPIKGKLAIAGTLPAGQGMADRKPTRFEVPLCGECRDRATSLSEDAKSARTQSILFSLIIGLALVVGALAFGLVDPGEMQLADFFLLGILFTIGFAGSTILLLNRINNYPPPLDAAYVRTTLLIPSETQGLETAFEWRNAEYAERFYEVNQSNALGPVTQVKDRLVLERS